LSGSPNGSGACSAAVSADSGHATLVYDIAKEKIKLLGSGDRDLIESCLFEEGLGDLLVRNKDRVEFTSNYRKVESGLDVCDSVFMCLPTPEIGETGSGPGRGYTLNAPLEAGSTIADYRLVFSEVFCPAVERFHPGLLLVSTNKRGKRMSELT
jgi:UDP-N-acetyl-D-mannosaminuronate dehydrogenase